MAHALKDSLKNVVKESEHEVAQSCPILWDLWTVAHQAPLFLGFSRQEYWSGLLFPSPGDLSDPGIKPVSPAFQADSLPAEPSGKPCASLCVLKIPPKIMMPE